MVQMWDVYRVGGKTGAVRDLIRGEINEHQRTYQRHERALSSVALRSVYGQFPTSAVDIDSDEYLLARVLLGLLQRGDAPLVSPMVERELLRQSGVSWESFEALNEKSSDVGFRLQLDDEEARSLSEILRFAQFATDPRATPDWGNRYDSHAEQRFVEDQLAPLLGRALPLLEPQRLLTTMLDPEVANVDEFIDQRVDFALQTPTLKVAFEIDGPHHDVPAQQLLDKKRDVELTKSGWIVERLPLNVGSPSILPEVRRRIENDDWLKTLRGWPNVELSDLGAARPLVTGAHSIVRVQLAVLVAILNGTLSWGAAQAWRICVFERDTPCAQVALVDLLQQFEALGELYGISIPFTVDLQIVGDQPHDAHRSLSHPRIQVGYIDLDMLQHGESLDLFIDVSVLARSADRFPDSMAVDRLRLLGTPVMELRTANYRSAERIWDWCAPRPVSPFHATERVLSYFLQLVFRKRAFRPQQVDVIQRALQRKNLIGLLPTGSGKSVTFQLPTLLSPGATIVIAPLRALIDDQADNLHRTGIGRLAAIHGGMIRAEKERRLRSISRENPRFIYVAPERLQMRNFRDELRASPLAKSVAFVVVDEAHCVSEWGHDFRPAYLNVGRVARDLCTTDAGEPPILALTGTASDTVLVDIARELEMDRKEPGLIIAAGSFDRPELNFLPITVPNQGKSLGLKRALNDVASLLEISTEQLIEQASQGGIVFCRYVNGDYGVTGASRYLLDALKVDKQRIRIYAGGQPKNMNLTSDAWNEKKMETQRAFKDNAFPLLVSTSSFGMGIDKANIRYTIHFGIPGSIEALAQEAGRAGRDRQEAGCAIVFSGEDQYEFLSPDMDTETARSAVEGLPRNDEDDITRLLFLHFQSYPGAEFDIADTRKVMLSILGVWLERGTRDGDTTHLLIRRRGMNDKSTEHALYRLSVLGVVRDYTIDYGKGVFEVETIRINPDAALSNLYDYVKRYNAQGKAQEVQDRALTYGATELASPYDHVIRALSEFIYDVIERSRRRALQNLVEELRESGGDGKKLREGISKFLSSNVFTSAVTGIALSAHHDPTSWWSQIDGVDSPDMAAYLLSVTRRQLESNPTHPGLLLIEAVSAMLGEVTDADAIAASVLAGLDSYDSSREADGPTGRELLPELLKQMARATPQRFDRVIGSLLQRDNRPEIARAAYPYVTDRNLRRVCAVPWIESMTTAAQVMRQRSLGVR